MILRQKRIIEKENLYLTGAEYRLRRKGMCSAADKHSYVCHIMCKRISEDPRQMKQKIEANKKYLIFEKLLPNFTYPQKS